MREMLVPAPWRGDAVEVAWQEMKWLRLLPQRCYCALWQAWPTTDLPPGYDVYVISFHLEAVDVAWIQRQSKLLTQPIIVLSDGQYYNTNFGANVFCYTFLTLHLQLQKMINWFGIQPTQAKTFKFSAVCNRITQSKIWTITKLLETAQDHSVLVLHNWLEDKNVHGWQPTGHATLDQLTEVFRQKYLGQDISVDNFAVSLNYQKHTGNPWHPLYQNCVINFTNESFHYSDMGNHIWPGPFITEKTLKCLLGACAFVAVGQFETYQTLSQLGFNFDYFFNTSWDLDSGNISRLASIVELIDDLNQFDVAYLEQHTRDINLYNQNHIISGKFEQQCEAHNRQIVHTIIDKVRTIV